MVDIWKAFEIFNTIYQTLNDATSCCCRELLLLSMTVSMGMLIFAGLAYALEKDEPGTMFYTLPQTLYWAIITMTSTGTVLYSTVQYSTA